MTAEEIEAIGWKYGEGICTRHGEITLWPTTANGGVVPTQLQIDSAVAEYAGHLAAQPKQGLQSQVAAAIADLDAYLALPDPTAAQAREQVRRLSQMMRRVIQRLVQVE